MMTSALLAAASPAMKAEYEKGLSGGGLTFGDLSVGTSFRFSRNALHPTDPTLLKTDHRWYRYLTEPLSGPYTTGAKVPVFLAER